MCSSTHLADCACKRVEVPSLLGGQARHGRAMQAARTSKRGSREAEAALLSLDALHKQVGAGPMCIISGGFFCHVRLHMFSHICACIWQLTMSSLQ
jgi:hypothetical protein